jgi:hypothetical protein
MKISAFDFGIEDATFLLISNSGFRFLVDDRILIYGKATSKTRFLIYLRICFID